MNKETKTTDFALQNIYAKDVSFEAPNNPRIFAYGGKEPKINFDLNIETAQLDEQHYEVTLHLTVTAKLQKKTDKEETEVVAFLAEIKQSGLFSIVGFSKADLEHILNVVAPEVIFPYARETISGLVAKGGFPQLLLPPMNFQGMYEQSKQQATDPANDAANDADKVTAN